jgi:protein-disulfide isomerase
MRLRLLSSRLLLYKHQANLSDEHLLKLAAQLGLPTHELTKVLTAGTYKSRVQEDLESGEKSGVTGTPMFYINGKLYEEDYDFNTIVEAITAAGND